jgi:hypothetical protein
MHVLLFAATDATGHPIGDNGESRGSPISKKRKLLERRKKKPTLNDSEEEIKRYIKHQPRSDEIDALAFWSEHAREFPRLSKLAQIYLCISIASVPVECMFSVSGLILNGKRSSIVPYRLNYLSVVHDNYPTFFDI